MIYKKRIVLSLSLIISLFILIFIVYYTTILISKTDYSNSNLLVGTWKNENKTTAISLTINKKDECKIIINNKNSTKEKKDFKGICYINYKKNPISLSIYKIDKLNYPLHTIIKIIDNKTLKLEKFSNKWRLRPIIFEDTLVLNKS